MVKPAPDALPPQTRIKNYFFTQKRTFAGLGIDPTSSELTIYNHFLAWIPMLSLVALVIPMSVYASQYIQDLDQVTDTMAPLLQMILAIIKLLCFMWNKKKIVRLVRKIWLSNLEAHHDELKIHIEENRKVHIFANSFYYWVSVSALMALVSPFVSAYFRYFKGYGFLENLDPPFKASYNYVLDPKSYTGYFCIFMWNVSAIYYVVYSSVGNDTLFTWFAHNIAAHFRVVKLRFKMAANAVRSKGDEDEFCKAIILRIQYHRYVIELANSFNEVYMVTVFLKFTISFLEMACVVFQIAHGGDFNAVVFHLLFLMSASLQLVLYCHGGQRIIDESFSVSVAIYDYFKWHELSIRSKKLLLLPMMRAQKSCNLTGVFFVADLRLFLWVFRTSGSFITMLMAMESKDRH